jgi:hypothetical protein
VFHTTQSVKLGAGHLTFGRSSLRKGSYRVTIVLTVGTVKSKAIVKTFTVK